MSKYFKIRESESIGRNKEVYFSISLSYDPEVVCKESELKSLLFMQASAKLIDEFKEKITAVSEELGI